ncbi:twin-arginine translocase TatA/TatE family subunit [uncultured Ilyobacter sp.]|uniref:twin-arginine translocase TatA/TatE family subunit n=1 Tax=uncultured Ilyobacter sp. TaxID=544433 RepID=UPI0029F52E8E|nr:twin-arginine translocase TatA/TatE family subunit [uncultured Ilyobacter sp.]
MFGLGFTEIIIILVVILVVVKPEDLPKFFKRIGQLYSELKKTCSDVNKMKDDFIKLADEEEAKEDRDIPESAELSSRE